MREAADLDKYFKSFIDRDSNGLHASVSQFLFLWIQFTQQDHCQYVWCGQVGFTESKRGQSSLHKYSSSAAYNERLSTNDGDIACGLKRCGKRCQFDEMSYYMIKKLYLTQYELDTTPPSNWTKLINRKEKCILKYLHKLRGIREQTMVKLGIS